MPYMWDLGSSSLEVEPGTGIWVNVIYGGCAFMRWGVVKETGSGSGPCKVGVSSCLILREHHLEARWPSISYILAVHVGQSPVAG